MCIYWHFLNGNVKKVSDTTQTLLILNYMHLISNTFHYAHQRELNRYNSFQVTLLATMSKFKS